MAAMKDAITNRSEAVRMKMSKLVAVANPDSTDGWIQEIERHYTLNSITLELNLEKLQLIATSKASSAFKIKWLEYFNSSAATREARRVPPKPANEERLSNFLAKTSEKASTLYDEIMRTDQIPVNMKTPTKPLTLTNYIEDCRLKLWDQAFLSYFRGVESFKNIDDFGTFKGSDLVVRRVLYK